MSIIHDNQSFLQQIFGEDWPRAHVCQFPQPPDSPQGGNWKGMSAAQANGQLEQEDWNQFYTVSLFDPAADGSSRRTKDLFKAQYALVLDDLGTGPGAKIPFSILNGKPLPQYAIETSKDNYQIIYIFEQPVTDADLLARVIDALIEQGLSADADPGFKGVTRYVRMPYAINNKLKYGYDFHCQISEIDPAGRVTIPGIVEGWGLTVTPPGKGLSIKSTPTEVLESISYKLLTEHNLWTGEQGAGWYGVPCPQQELHTVDDGRTALNIEDGSFKCMHGSCEGLNRGDLERWLVRKYAGDGGAEFYFGAGSVEDVAPGINAFVARAIVLSSDQTAQASALMYEASKVLNPLDMDILIDALNGIGFAKAALKATLKAAQKAGRGLGGRVVAEGVTVSLGANYLYIQEAGKYFNKVTKGLCTGTSFNVTHMEPNGEGGGGIPAEIRFKEDGGVTVRRLGWRPWSYYGEGEYILNEGGAFAEANSYMPPAMIPAHQDSALVGPWLQLFEYLVPDERERGIFMDWMALTLLHPEVKIQWGILFIGEPGVGKDAILTPLVRLLGENASEISKDDARAGWGDSRAKRKLLIYQEVMSDGDIEFENGLKTIIAGTAGSMDRLNMKGQGQVVQENLYSVVGMSNYWACLHLEPGDRRWFAISCMDIESLADQVYIDYHRWLAEGGVDAVCGWILGRDVSAFNYHTYPYHTEAYQEITEAVRSNASASIADAIRGKLGPFSMDLVTLEEIKKWYSDRSGGRGLNNMKLTRELKTLGVRRIKRQPRMMVNGNAETIARLYSVRNHGVYSEEGCSALYRRKVKMLAGEIFNVDSVDDK